MSADGSRKIEKGLEAFQKRLPPLGMSPPFVRGDPQGTRRGLRKGHIVGRVALHTIGKRVATRPRVVGIFYSDAVVVP